MGNFRSLSNTLADRIPVHHRGLVLVGSAAILWSSSGLFIKILTLSAFQIAAYRSLIAALSILAITALRGERLNLKLTPINLACALTYAGVLILFVASTKMTKAANAIFLQFSAPIYLLFLEPLVLKTPFRSRDLTAVLACFLGMGLFFLGKLESGHMLGNLLGVASGVFLAIFSLLLKRKSNQEKDENPVSAIVLGNLAVFIICLPLLIPALSGCPSVTLKQSAILLYLGVFQIGIAYMFFTAGMRYVSATGAMITSMLEAVFNPLWVFLGIGERPSAYGFAGALVMLAVIVWYNLRKDHLDVTSSA